MKYGVLIYQALADRHTSLQMYRKNDLRILRLTNKSTGCYVGSYYYYFFFPEPYSAYHTANLAPCTSPTINSPHATWSRKRPLDEEVQAEAAGEVMKNEETFQAIVRYPDVDWRLEGALWRCLSVFEWVGVWGR